MKYTTKIYSSLNPELYCKWKRLWESSPYASLINSPYWTSAVIQTFPDVPCTIIAVYTKDSLNAVIPLWKKRILSVLVYTSIPDHFTYGIPILADVLNNHLIKHLLAEMIQLGPCHFQNTDEQFVGTVNTYLQGLSFARTSTVNYSIDLQNDVDIRHTMSNKSVIFRRIKHISDRFTIRSANNTSDHALEEVFSIDKNSAKQAKGYATFSNTSSRMFYRLLQKEFKSNFLIHFLEYDSKPIAYSIGFVVHNTYIGSQLGYDLSASRFQPGKVLAYKIFEQLKNNSFSHMDLGTGDSHIKHLMSSSHRQLYAITLSRNSLVRNVLPLAINFREKIYTILFSNKKMYFIYKSIFPSV